MVDWSVMVTGEVVESVVLYVVLAAFVEEEVEAAWVCWMTC